MKPLNSAGSDGVFVVNNVAEAETAFNHIITMPNLFGDANTSVLIQEFLTGVEYVIDSYSYKGEHKCTGIWKYDKRLTNGSPLVIISNIFIKKLLFICLLFVGFIVCL